MNFSRNALLVFTLFFPVTWSQDFKESLDNKVNPCEDFYQHACGKWTPKNSEAVDTLTDQKMDNRRTIQQYFTSIRRRGIRDNPAEEYYQLCVASKFKSDEDNLRPYLSELLEISPWPYINDTFRASSFDWLQVAANLRHHRVDTLFQLSIQRNWKDSRQYIVYMTPTKTPFRGSADGNEAFMYKTYVKYLLLGFGDRVRKANAIAQEVVDFEVELGALHTHFPGELIDPITLESLIRQQSAFNWRRYFETLLGARPRLSQLLVAQRDFLKGLELLVGFTKPETIALAQLTRFLRHYHINMDPPDWISCIDEVNSYMPLLVSKNFLELRRTFTVSKVRQIFESISEEFQQRINSTNWYDASTKEQLRSKLEAIRILIGYPETEMRSQPEAQIDRGSYQRSRMLLEKHAARSEFNSLTRVSAFGSNNLWPLNVNAYYKLTTNTLEIPIGMLQPPIYREDSNFAQIMGSLGTVIAHELVHGFDYDGQNYDMKGNVKTEANTKALIQFGVRANCLIEQYSGGSVVALNEDIADNEGLRLAYGAYERFRENHPSPESAFSGDQLFFISFAQIFCRSEASKGGTRFHSSHKDRVNNAVANSEKFAAAFSCQQGSILNPVKKCQIWK